MDFTIGAKLYASDNSEGLGESEGACQAFT